MRILGISGLWCTDKRYVWNTVFPAFLSEFPGAECVMESELNCQPWQIGRLCRFAQRLAEKYDDGVETLLVGHSMGGVIACIIADQFQCTHIAGIVTIFSPHQFLFGLYPRILSAPGSIEAPILSLGATRDWLVWWGAKHPHAKKYREIQSNHLSDLKYHSAVAREIAEITKSSLFI